MQDIEQAITASLARDGRGGMLGHLPMGGKRVIGIADGIDDTDAASMAQLRKASGSNTRADLAAMKAADPSDKTSLYDGSLWTWTFGNFVGQADDVNVVKADSAALSTGAWIRQKATGISFGTRSVSARLSETVSVKDTQFAGGAKGDGTTDDRAAFQAANDYLATLGGGTIAIPIGDYLLSAVVTLHPRVSLQGSGNQQTIIHCAGSGFMSVAAASDHGQTVFHGFRMIGAGRTTGTALAIAMADEVDAGLPRRIRGLRFADIQIENFNIALQAKSMWDADVSIAAHNVSFGIRLQGQCVNCNIVGASLTSEGSNYNDGSVGVLCDEYVYADSISRRPEEPKIIGGTRVFGFDTDVWINRALKATIAGCSLDGALRVGLRLSTADYSYVVDDVYFATIHDTRGTVMLLIDALGTANSALGSLNRLTFAAAGVYTDNSIALQYNGSNRTGKLTINNCNIGLGALVGTALYLNTAENVEVRSSTITGQQYSYRKDNTGGHLFERCTINGPINRPLTGIALRPDRFADCDGSAVTGYRGAVTVPAGATTATLSLASLGLPSNPVIGVPANLTMVAQAYQYNGSASRGMVRAYYDGVGNVVINVGTAFGTDSNDINLELTAQ